MFYFSLKPYKSSKKINTIHNVMFYLITRDGILVIDKTISALSNATIYDTKDSKVNLPIMEKEIGRISDANIWNFKKSGK